MTYVFLLGIAGLAIWLFNKQSSNKQNTNFGPNSDPLDNNVSSLPTIQNDMNLPSTITIMQPTADIKSQSALSPTNINNLPKQKSKVQSLQINGWISPESSIDIAGYQISNGFIYVGKDLKAANGYQIECALINPNLKVDRNNDDYRIRRLNYWPSYSEASPDARAAYLRWLSTGKNDPDADIGYVFLYFYGLERRLLYDAALGKSVSNTEIQALINEVDRLLNIYGNNGSFSSYANSLLTYMQADHYCEKKQYISKPPNPTNHFGLPIILQIGIGQMATDNIAIPSDWILAWYFSTPNPPVYARTPAHRCRQEFQELFTEEYMRIFGQGLRLKDNKTRLKIKHRPASSSLLSEDFTKTLDLPDIRRQASVVNEIAPIIKICQDKLDSYSRYLGRNPENKDTFDALLELPESIWPDNIKKYFSSLQSILREKNELTLKFSTLLEHFPEWHDKSKKRFLLFMERLDSCHIGMEPDLRITGIKPEPDTEVILFQSDGTAINDVSVAYSLMALTMHLAAIVSQADGNVSATEMEMLKLKIERSPNLNQSEKKRLKAYLQWLISQPLTTRGIKKKIQFLEVMERELIGEMLVQVSQADGIISTSEIKLMEKIFKLLEIDLNVLYSKIHSSYAEPVTVKVATESDNGFSIPVPTPNQATPEKTFSLDMTKVAFLHKETEHVTSILNVIFNQDEGEQMDFNLDHPETKSEEPYRVWGLTPSVYEIVQILSNRSTWHRRELEELAYNQNFMLEGVLEEINEAAFEHFEEPFIEGEDPLEINQEIAMVVNQ